MNKQNKDWQEKYIDLFKDFEILENKYFDAIDNLDKVRKETIRDMDKLLLDQLYRFEGVLGMYNCQHGGTKCNFQTNCHRLIREEISKLNGKET